MAPRRPGRPTFHSSAKKRGQGGEDQASLTLKLLGFDVQAVGAKQLRSFLDYATRAPRLGWALKDDGDILGLFDMIAWSDALTLRLQVKDHAEVTAPPARWRADVDTLRHPPATLDCWWSRDVGGDFWWSWERQPGGLWTYRTLDLLGNKLTPQREYVAGQRRVGP